MFAGAAGTAVVIVEACAPQVGAQASVFCAGAPALVGGSWREEGALLVQA